LDEANDLNDVVLANLPAGRVERRIALVVGLVLLGIGVAVVPFGRVRLPDSPAWAPTTDTFIFVADLITWFLLISQFNIVRSRALLVLASGYLFAAVMNIPHLLTFPGAFSPTGLLGAGLQTSVWLAIFWMCGYPSVVIFYSVMKKEPRALVLHGSSRTAVAASIAVVIAIALVLTWIAVAGDPYLPKLFVNSSQGTVGLRRVSVLLLLPNAVALFLIWLRGRSVLDLWLTVVMCGWMGQGIAQVNTPGRFTLAMYAARSLFSISSTVVLVVLLRETMTLYGRLAVSLVALRRLSAEQLQRSEAYLAEAQRLSHTGSFGLSVRSGEIFWSEETYRIFELDRSTNVTMQAIFQRFHPDDRNRVQEALDHRFQNHLDFDIEHRLLMPAGGVKHIHTLARAVKTSEGDLEYVGAVTDVTLGKQAQEKIRQSETELRQILDFTPQLVAVLGPDRERTRLYANQTLLDYFGFTLEQWLVTNPQKYYHPDDWEVIPHRIQSDFLSGIPYEYEARFLSKDGKYRWFLFRWNPLRDEQGRVTRWYVASTDIEDRKQAEQRLQSENVALREEIDRTSMFEEIVGTSPALRAVLSRVSKVAPTDSTVLITGETGTGKELIARAVHKRSQRSSRAFVSVNCAAIPRDLIASELFGHEKGAFTGATQRRLGRFELAEGGTIFLDEIGELPAETQIALLRVLQEREFERVGGTGPIRTNVRVIAATNRDLLAAIAGSTFRSDLFYRLNVFPIEMPPLRGRREDIQALVEYFIDRYARKAGKRILGMNKTSLELLQSYPWPGNIRELQNIIERSVIVCDSENFSVDESWLTRQPPRSEPKSQPELSRKIADEEKGMIEAALRESGGRVSGPSGAAVKLGIPGSTLDSKIRALRIDKNRFKTTNSSSDRP
jgi:PAS domain S-box-containing protein